MTNNYVLLNGKLSRDIEVSKNDKGNSFVKFCLICTRDGINSYSDYINCIAFGEIANAICRKGEKDTAYHIEGNIRTNSYEKNGKKNYSTNVVVESFRLLDAQNQTMSILSLIGTVKELMAIMASMLSVHYVLKERKLSQHQIKRLKNGIIMY